MMAIKNLICDLGGVWLPIDEKRTLAAFAALAGGGTALDAAGGPDCRRRSRRDERGDEPQSRRETTNGASADAAGGPDCRRRSRRDERGDEPQSRREATDGASADAAGGPDCQRRSQRDERGDEPQSRREATDGTSADAAAAQALAARLQPDVLAYELGAIDDATLLSRLRNALTSAANHAPDGPDCRRRSRRDERGDEPQSRRETTDGASAAGGPDSGTAQATALSDEALIQAWNAMLLPFPEAHLPLLDAYGQRYRLFLLSNTNALHIRYVEQDFQSRFPGRKPFLQHFEKAYLSHELHLRKPQPEIYAHVLCDAGLRPEETLFIDDRAENIAAAAALGLHTRLHPANAPLTTLPL